MVIRLVLLLSMIVVTGCATTTVREHPDIESHLSRMDSVVVAPPAVSIQQVNFTGDNERLVEVENAIQQELIQLARVGLQERGFEVIEFDFERAIEEDEEFAYTVTQVREGFAEARAQLYRRGVVYEENKRDVKASIGSAVNMVSEKSGADAVMLIHYSGMKKSGGEVAKDIAVGVMIGLLTGSAPISNTEASHVEIAIIDGVTGDVVWTNILNSPHLSARVADMALDKLPNDIDPPVAQ